VLKDGVLAGDQMRSNQVTSRPSNGSAGARMAAMIQRRLHEPWTPGIKVNLYRNYEYRAAAHAVRERSLLNVETVMVGDSYFMTHLGRDSTNLNPEDSRLATEVLPKLIAELRTEIDKDEFAIGRPLLMADIPSGLSDKQTREVIRRFADEGAEVIKAEAISQADLWPLDVIRETGLIAAVHLGYTPQKGINRVYGQNAQEVSDYVRLLDAAREGHGAAFVIFERLAELANVVLSRYALTRGVLSYSIFSGRAPFGGQSLNIWDAVVKSDRNSIFFPPTAHLERSEVERSYDGPAIFECMAQLLTLTTAGAFPPSPHNKLDVKTCLDILNAVPQ
jgi:ketopantoate hydroxymethyltransferase